MTENIIHCLNELCTFFFFLSFFFSSIFDFVYILDIYNYVKYMKKK